jgi:hypothetical protein
VAGLLALLTGLATATAAREPSAPPAIASYTIDVRYQSDAHAISGSEILRWRNNTSHPANELQFHLYLNAFANSRSTFMRESQEAWIDWAEKYDDPWGYIELQSIRIADSERVGDARFIQPDDGNADDRTVLAVPLETPVAPGTAIEISIQFTSRLPRAFSRTGYAGPFAMMAQWFPKIGVFEASGKWNCHQYHWTTEFFADFGTYDVTVHVPPDSVVGATGALVEERIDADGNKRLRFRADAVHDFAWALDPRFEVVERKVGNVTARLLVQPAHRPQADRYLDALQAAIEYYEKWIGSYPYGQITLVDPGPGAFAAGGMEYPTLITLGTTWWMPTGLRIPEIVTVHEYGHQYWYGMIANNEFEHAWLDEGVNSFLEGRIMDGAYGAASYIDLFGLQSDSTANLRLTYLRAPEQDPIAIPAWQFLDRRSYGAVSYAKTALALDTLDRRYGAGVVRDALADFFQAQRFSHPQPEQFLATLTASVGEDLTSYFDQLVFGTGVVDYAVTEVECTEVKPLQGYEVEPTEARLAESLEAVEPMHFRSHVIVQRLGSVALPISIEIRFDDGTSSFEEWDGIGRWKRFEYVGTQRIDWAVADPKEVLSLDVNRLNNSRMRRAGTRGIVRLSVRWAFWFQSLVQILTGM